MNSEEALSVGQLLVVGTPIGNLSDLSARGLEALRSADFLACEDSRRTGQLVSHLGVGKTKMIVVNDHTETDQVERIVDSIAGGKHVVLVSDAGMPTISDPGHRLVAAVVGAGMSVGVVPGPTAVTATLAVSGFPADRFVFEGFLPRKGVERRRRLEELASEQRTVVLYEAPHRVEKTLADLIAVRGGENLACVGRELTKLYEEVIHGSLAELQDLFAATSPRGEFVFVLAGVPPAVVDDDELLRRLMRCAEKGMSRRDAVADVVHSSGCAKRRVYDLALTVTF